MNTQERARAIWRSAKSFVPSPPPMPEIIHPSHYIREVSMRELSKGHVAVICADYSASDDEVLGLIQKKHPRLLGWFIQEYYRDDDNYYWMVIR